MRTVLLFMCVGIGAGIYFLDNPHKLWGKALAAQSWVSDFNSEKEVIVDGADHITDEEMESILPLDRSVFWWWWNRDRVSSQLTSHMRIRSARVDRCGGLAWRCFRISVEERAPAFIAKVGQRAWQVDREGAFVGTAGSTDRDLSKLPVVEGVLQEGSSPEVTSARVRYVALALKTIESELKFSVATANLKGNGELEVVFNEFPFTAVFESDTMELDVIRAESQRLKRLLQEFSGKEVAIERVDLAFNQTAVVTLRGESEPGKEAKAS